MLWLFSTRNGKAKSAEMQEKWCARDWPSSCLSRERKATGRYPGAREPTFQVKTTEDQRVALLQFIPIHQSANLNELHSGPKILVMTILILLLPCKAAE